MRIAVALVLSLAFGPAAAGAEPPAAVAAPGWSLHYSTFSVGGRIQISRTVVTHPDGRLDWQQIDIDTSIAGGAGRRCNGSANLIGDELQAMLDAERALDEPHPAAAPEASDAAYVPVLVARIAPRESGGADVKRVSFDPHGRDADPRLKRAAAIWSRYRCER